MCIARRAQFRCANALCDHRLSIGPREVPFHACEEVQDKFVFETDGEVVLPYGKCEQGISEVKYDVKGDEPCNCCKNVARGAQGAPPGSEECSLQESAV